jgi:hypothetical protein
MCSGLKSILHVQLGKTSTIKRTQYPLVRYLTTNVWFELFYQLVLQT